MSNFAFDPEQLVTLSTEGEMSTKLPHIPEGEYQAVIESIKGATVGDENKPVLNVRVLVDDPKAMEATKLEKPFSKKTVWLDITDEGQLDMSEGKNVDLGRLREAVGQNTAGSWTPIMLEGQRVTVLIGNRVDKNSGDIYDEVRRFSAPQM